VSIGDNVRRIREERGLTQTEIARRCEVAQPSIWGLEHGEFNPSSPLLVKLAKALDVPIEDLLEEPVPLDEAPSPGPSRYAGEELTSQEWARHQGARLHGMTAEGWDDYLRAHDTVEELGETWQEICDESRMLHDALSEHKRQRPQDRGRRQSLGRGLRDLRMRRYADLYASAKPLHARDLVDEIFEAMREEANA
jgi:transcriptional regulator with XRE-family HTH domain